MTDYQKNAIIKLRRGGVGYAKIAKELGLSVNTVKSFGRRHEQDAVDEFAACEIKHCLHCGALFPQMAGRKSKRFCSDGCRFKWWYAHREKSESARQAVCLACGKMFTARRGQKFCCHPCFISTQFGNRPRVRKKKFSQADSVVSASPVVDFAAILPEGFSLRTGE